MKAIFELAPLTIFSGDDVPIEAVERSAMAMNVLQTLYATVEEKRNKRQWLIRTIEHLKVDSYIRNADLDPSKCPASTPLHRTDVDTDHFKFVINSRPLFRDLPVPGKLPVRAMTMEDLKAISKYQDLYHPAHWVRALTVYF